ncbi:MSEP-CTERM sorting domain-containing protein [Rapidithrix thailandica]|uniref:MSEP-CTERM sorting domain-containing protein n=1 Tax=Rapidithrix thailandica TaxID=413964 RepID=A0AAW9RZY5_9BACT
MKTLLNPKWLLLTNTLPFVVTFVIYWETYQIIHTLLTPESLTLWGQFGMTFSALVIVNLSYSIIQILRKEVVQIWFALYTFLISITFFYFYFTYESLLIPINIPQWMLAKDMYLYLGFLTMPALFHALLILVVHLTPNPGNKSAWQSFLMGLLCPFACYLFFQILVPMDFELSFHTIIIVVISLTVLFIFSLTRGVYLLAMKKRQRKEFPQWLWKVPIALLLPLTGLILNNGHLPEGIRGFGNTLFGDFSHPIFYIITVFNGTVLCIPPVSHKISRIGLFITKAATFSYTLYFFIIFLPFLPLSIPAVLFLGLGFLLLSPLFLFLLHIKSLTEDFHYLSSFLKKPLLYVFGLLGLATLPVAITYSYWQDKIALKEALHYVYQPDFTSPNLKKIDPESLNRVLKTIRKHKNPTLYHHSLFPHAPFLAPFYQWLVLDNLTLSNEKLSHLEKVFLGETPYEENFTASTGNMPQAVEISNIQVQSAFDRSENTWRSQIDLELTNTTGQWMAEFATTFQLPEGCWVSDYYLWVNDVKEPGILAEKKTATWIYNNILSTRKDPGILYYLPNKRIAFKVFPFAIDEVRKTGFELIHKEPFKLEIGGKELILGDLSQTLSQAVKLPHGYYLSERAKQTLPRVKRKPYFHFIVDCSQGKQSLSASYIKKVEQLFEKGILDKNTSKFSFTNAYTQTYPYSKAWKEHFRTQACEGGFYLERAIKEVLVKSYHLRQDVYPVIIVLSDWVEGAILQHNFSDYKLAFPESDFFYEVSKTGELIPHSLLTSPAAPLEEKVAFNPEVEVYAWPNTRQVEAFLPLKGASIIPHISPKIEESEELHPKTWESAFALNAQWLSHCFHQENFQHSWLNLVKNSFHTQIMTPVTSFIVVENEAQKAMLKKKQEQMLNSSGFFDLGEEPEAMSEPGLLLMLLLGLVCFLLKQWIQNRKRFA